MIGVTTQAPAVHSAPAWVSVLWLFLLVGIWAAGVRGVTRYSEEEYQSVGASKSVWLIAAWVLGGLGGLMWLLGPRRRLRANRVRS